MPIKINGLTSGYTEIKAADTAANNTLTLPSASGTLMTTGGSNTFTANQVIEVTDNINAALRITQLGTANALVVEDSTNPDNTPFVVDASGNVGIGVASPTNSLDSLGNIRTRGNFLVANTNGLQLGDDIASGFISYGYSSTRTNAAGHRWYNGLTTEVMRIEPSGLVGLGRNPNYTLDVYRSGTNSGQVAVTNDNIVTMLYNATNVAGGVGTVTSHPFLLISANAERARIDTSGRMYIGTASTDLCNGNTVGIGLGSTQNGGVAVGASQFSVASNASINVNRKTDDGNLVTFYQDGTLEGSISVAGTTVTYGSFSGSHWSQLSDNSKPDIIVGTVVESIDEKCSWPGEENDQLAKFKISDTVASKRVYGVFMAWDNDDLESNDAYITGVGAYVVRVAPGVTVEGGDLLESNGDGCARVQADDIVRSSTIAKVTCNIPTETYADGSYTVPCVLYCG